MRLVYSEEAVDELVRLRTFIAEKGPAAAAKFAAELIARVEHLCRFPEMGRSVAQSPDTTAVHDAVFGKYIARYSTHAEVIVILRVWHHYENRDA